MGDSCRVMFVSHPFPMRPRVARWAAANAAPMPSRRDSTFSLIATFAPDHQTLCKGLVGTILSASILEMHQAPWGMPKDSARHASLAAAGCPKKILRRPAFELPTAYFIGETRIRLPNAAP